MIYLTEDVHTKLNGSWEQRIAGKEIDSAKKYLEIFLSYILFFHAKPTEL